MIAWSRETADVSLDSPRDALGLTATTTNCDSRTNDAKTLAMVE